MVLCVVLRSSVHVVCYRGVVDWCSLCAVCCVLCVVAGCSLCVPVFLSGVCSVSC